MLVEILLSLVPFALYAAVDSPLAVLANGPPPPSWRVAEPPTTRFIIELGVKYDEIELDRWPDYDYYFAARITPAQWEKFHGTLGADWTSGGVWGWSGWGNEPRPTWWRAKEQFDGLFRQTDRMQEFVKYENGVLYYRSRSS